MRGKRPILRSIRAARARAFPVGFRHGSLPPENSSARPHAYGTSGIAADEGVPLALLDPGSCARAGRELRSQFRGRLIGASKPTVALLPALATHFGPFRSLELSSRVVYNITPWLAAVLRPTPGNTCWRCGSPNAMFACCASEPDASTSRPPRRCADSWTAPRRTLLDHRPASPRPRNAVTSTRSSPPSGSGRRPISAIGRSELGAGHGRFSFEVLLVNCSALAMRPS